MHELFRPIADLMQVVGRETIMPRFCALAESEILEKSPGELVTIADRESEARLTEGLAVITPYVRIVGEEAVAADPTLMDGIGSGAVWLVDPIDGTHNFAHGHPPFGLMIALIEDGAPCAAWLHDPVTGRMCHAAAGGGAFIDGERIETRGTGERFPLAALATGFLPPDERERVTRRAQGRYTMVEIPRCAAEQYPRLALGQNDIALFWRTLPWDHAAGALLVNEGGGRVARLDGSSYRVGDDGKGLLGAATPQLWDEAAATIFL